jgi:iron complex transport system ATP-binding protein
MSSEFSGNILDVQATDYGYPGEQAFMRGLDLGLREGEFAGLLGPNGSGKSTLLKLMAGILRPDSGAVTLWGKPLSQYPHRDRAKLVSYLPQTLDMNVPFKVDELAEMGLYPYDTVTGMDIKEALGLVGLSDKRDVLISRLSGGERRRAYIAMTLMQGAGILLLDEPMANLDIRYQVEIISLLRKLNHERGITILMALHDINIASRFGRLVLIKEGAVVKDGPPADVMDERLLSEAFETRVKVTKAEGETFVSC